MKVFILHWSTPNECNTVKKRKCEVFQWRTTCTNLVITLLYVWKFTFTGINLLFIRGFSPTLKNIDWTSFLNVLWRSELYTKGKRHNHCLSPISWSFRSDNKIFFYFTWWCHSSGNGLTAMKKQSVKWVKPVTPNRPWH